jgi:hypothetical protein
MRKFSNLPLSLRITTKYMQAFIFSVTRAACPVNLSLFHSIVLLAFAEE